MPHYHKADRDEFIRYLATKFPKCFSEQASQRQPLKHDILVDLERKNVLDPTKLSQALDWYMDDFAYRYSLLPGADRVDLNGNKAGTVTPEEHREARNWVAARKRELKERQASLAPPAHVVATNNKVNGATHVITKSNSSLPPALADMQAAITVVGNLMSDKQFEALRATLTTAALREIVAKAEALIAEVTAS